jgi:hypothetical protein
MRVFPAVLVLAPLVVACSRTPRPETSPTPAAAATPATAAVAPAPAPAPGPADLSGTWDFEVDAGGQVIPGVIVLQRAAGGYTGTITPQGMAPATVRTLEIQGQRVRMWIDTPDGEAHFEGSLAADGRSLSGSVDHLGQTFSLTARRR